MRKTKTAFLLGALVFCSACEVVDFSGYFYSTDPVNARVKQSLEWNGSHPERDITISSPEYCLLIAGDSHVGSTANLDSLITRANTDGVSGLVLVGDLTTGNEEDLVILKQELDSKNDGPAFLMVGNHDLFFNGWDTYFDLFGSSTYSFSVRSNDTTDLYICLDSGSGTFGWRQLEWLKDQLETERKNARFCVLFTHVNFFRTRRTLSTNPLVDELGVIIDLCYTYSVDMVIMGHDHERSEEFLGVTRYVTLDALRDDFEDASYLELQVKASGLTRTFIKL